MKRNYPKDVWRFIEKRGEDECWPWIGTRDNTGYGRIGINYDYYAAHRIVYALEHPGEIEWAGPKFRKGKGNILHSCDHPWCCNPRHLSLGSQRDNMQDMIKKGRQASKFGEKNPNAKLCQKDANDIRWISSKGIATSEIARIYGLVWSTIDEIVKGRRWCG